ncbi:MAG: nucleotidyltransferase domain-containing protein [Thermoplasmata archaeon]|nr:nucleotidyltransferase domain-containing protein [Thermoplasmata archaeon]
MRKKSSGSVKIFYPKYDRDHVIRVLNERVKELKKLLPITKVVLFGSYAKNNYTVRSDIDILVVYKDPKRDDAFKVIKKTIGLSGLEPHVYTEEEYREMKDVLNKMLGERSVVIFDE